MAKQLFKVKMIFLGFFVVFSIFFSLNNLVFASATVGTIDADSKYAWGENIGWLNFGCDHCSVVVTDDNLSGNAWSKQYGWIKLNPDTSGVLNNGEGTLSGFAWSSNLGWINFTGVTINSSGEFLGYATVDSDSSQINFNCINGGSCSLANFKVKTDWRPVSTRPVGGGHVFPPSTPPVLPPTIPPITPPTIEPILPPVIQPILPPIITNPVIIVADNIGGAINSFYDYIFSFFRPQVDEPTPVIVQIPKVTPLSFGVSWDILPVKAINSFVFAPLPHEVRTLALKFPELNKTLKDVGIKRLSDLSKLSGVTLNLPGLSELTNTLKNIGTERLADLNKLSGVSLDISGLSNLDKNMVNNIGIGIKGSKIALIAGLPLAKFSLSAKKNLPTEFVFARTGGELVDLNVAISISSSGGVTQQMSLLPGKMLKLVVKPISRANSVIGYFIFRGATPKITQTQIPRASFTASALFSMNDLVESVPDPIPVEKKLVLSSFEYTDSDHDGIYTADVVSPVTPGEYEIITMIDYVDPVLGSRRMSMVTVIDPEGYVFEKNNGKETRIPSAIVSLYSLNNATKKYELWTAKEYSQENPQITDVRGTYSFLVPEGSYYFLVEAPGYDAYHGKVFVVSEGSGIHQNIELKSGSGWFTDFNPQTVLLFVVLLLLVYNLYRNRLRDKLLIFKNNGK